MIEPKPVDVRSAEPQDVVMYQPGKKPRVVTRVSLRDVFPVETGSSAVEALVVVILVLVVVYLATGGFR